MAKEGAAEVKKAEEERKAREVAEAAKEEDEERKRKAAEAANQRTQPFSTATKPEVLKLTDNPTTLGHFKDDYNKLKASYDAEVKTLTPQQKELLAPEMARQEARFENITQQRLLQAEIARTQDPAQKKELQTKASQLLNINLQMNEIYNRAFAAAGARGGGPVEYNRMQQEELIKLQTQQHVLISPDQMKAVQDAQLDNVSMPAAWTAPTQQDRNKANSKFAAPPTKLTIEGLQKISGCPAGIQLRTETHQGTVVSCASREEAETFAKKFRANVSVEPDKQNNGRFVFIISHKTAKAIADHQKDTPWISMDDLDKGAANGATAKSQSPQAAPGVPQPSPIASVANANAASPSSQPQKQKPGQLTLDQVRVINEGVIGVEYAQVNKPVVYFADKARAEAFAKQVFGAQPPTAQSATHQTNPGLAMYSVALDPETAKAIMEHATNLGAEEKAKKNLLAAKTLMVEKRDAANKSSEELKAKKEEHESLTQDLSTKEAAAKKANEAAVKQGASTEEIKAATTATQELQTLKTKISASQKELAPLDSADQKIQAESKAATDSVAKLQAALSAAAEKTADAKATGFIPVDKRKEMAASKVEIENAVKGAQEIIEQAAIETSTAEAEAAKKVAAAGAGAQPAALAEEEPTLTALKASVAKLGKAEANVTKRNVAAVDAKIKLDVSIVILDSLQSTGEEVLLAEALLQNGGLREVHQAAEKDLTEAKHQLADAKFAVKLAMDAHTNPPTHQLSQAAKPSKSSLDDLEKKRNTAYSERNAAQTPKAIELAQHALNKAEQAFAVATQATEKGLATPAEALKLEQQALDAAKKDVESAQKTLQDALPPSVPEVDGVAPNAPDSNLKLIADFIAAERALFAEPKAPAAEGNLNLPLNVPTDKETVRDIARAALAVVISDDEGANAKINALQTAIATEMTAQEHVKKAQAAVTKDAAPKETGVAKEVKTQVSAAAVTKAESLVAPAAPAAAAIPDPLKLTAVERRFQDIVVQNSGSGLASENAEMQKGALQKEGFSEKEQDLFRKIIAKKDEIKTAQAEEARQLSGATFTIDNIAAIAHHREAAQKLIKAAEELEKAQKDAQKASEKLTKLQSKDNTSNKDVAQLQAARMAKDKANQELDAKVGIVAEASKTSCAAAQASGVNMTENPITEKDARHMQNPSKSIKDSQKEVLKHLDNQLKAEQAKLKTSLVGPDTNADALSKASGSVEKKMEELAKLQEKLAKVSQEKASGHAKTAQKLQQGGVFTKGIKDLQAEQLKQNEKLAETEKQKADVTKAGGTNTKSLDQDITALKAKQQVIANALSTNTEALSEANAAKEAQSKIASEMSKGQESTKGAQTQQKNSGTSINTSLKLLSGAGGDASSLTNAAKALAAAMRAKFTAICPTVTAPPFLSPSSTPVAQGANQGKGPAVGGGAGS